MWHERKTPFILNLSRQAPGSIDPTAAAEARKIRALQRGMAVAL